MNVRQLIMKLLNHDLDTEVKMGVGSNPMATIGAIELETDPEELHKGPIVTLKSED